jgi:hypothetical protein
VKEQRQRLGYGNKRLEYRDDEGGPVDEKRFFAFSDGERPFFEVFMIVEVSHFRSLLLALLYPIYDPT